MDESFQRQLEKEKAQDRDMLVESQRAQEEKIGKKPQDEDARIAELAKKLEKKLEETVEKKLEEKEKEEEKGGRV